MPLDEKKGESRVKSKTLMQMMRTQQQLVTTEGRGCYSISSVHKGWDVNIYSDPTLNHKVPYSARLQDT